MIAPASNSNSVFSAEVCLTLEVSGRDLPISTVEPDRFVLAQPQQLEACDAVLVISVNGEPRRTPIRLMASPVPTREFNYSVR
jgi:hypothetical protein